MRVETKEFTKTQLFRFREFPVYKAVRELRIELKALSKKKFPKTEQYALTSQLWRALDSILLNIAEGSDRYSDIDFSRFLNTALTSVNEVVACLDAAMDDGYISTEEQEKSLSKLDNISRQLKAFSSKVRNSGS
ncbi:MAG: S23 ribosomal protein [Parcubacteria group bacterium GW2011_GWA2_51_12]|nr:MAG: S23 ribosomal protein [Parcubacteria group bacterium GW2011_GWA2_51_12]